ncbi:MAG: hypothetical protein N7Q72_05150, partial [Spiroplasma sp. Tabriz.8]|nr:hypothetical protein [Spiroplasma sp. Tabriz.8]
MDLRPNLWRWHCLCKFHLSLSLSLSLSLCVCVIVLFSEYWMQGDSISCKFTISGGCTAVVTT